MGGASDQWQRRRRPRKGGEKGAAAKEQRRAARMEAEDNFLPHPYVALCFFSPRRILVFRARARFLSILAVSVHHPALLPRRIDDPKTRVARLMVRIAAAAAVEQRGVVRRRRWAVELWHRTRLQCKRVALDQSTMYTHLWIAADRYTPWRALRRRQVRSRRQRWRRRCCQRDRWCCPGST